MPVLVSVENEKHYFTLSKQNLLNRFLIIRALGVMKAIFSAYEIKDLILS